MQDAIFTIPRLQTARLLLREYRQGDFDAFAAFYETDRSRFIAGPMSRELAWRGLAAHLGHWALRGYGFWAVEDRATGAFCGHVGLWFPEGWMEPEVGWVMMGDAEGRGIAQEAALAARSYAYDTLGWKTAVSMIDPGNARSIRLAERLGCRMEGVYTHVRLGPMQIWRHPAPADLAMDMTTLQETKMERAKAEGIVHIEDDKFKVTEWRFAPGAETGWHRHGHDYVIVPLTDGTLSLDLPGGAQAQAALTQGVPYSRREGVEHNVINARNEPLAFLEVETIADHLAQERRATLVRFMAAWNARDVDALMDCMAAECAFHASAGPEAAGTVYQGREAVQASYAAMFQTFPEAAWSADSHHVAGETGVSEWRFTGVDRTGKAVDVQGCDIFRFDGALIALKDSYRKARTAP